MAKTDASSVVKIISPTVFFNQCSEASNRSVFDLGKTTLAPAGVLVSL